MCDKALERTKKETRISALFQHFSHHCQLLQMLYSKESNPSSYWMESLNKSIRMAIRLTFALPQFLSKKKNNKRCGQSYGKKAHKRIRWHLKENQELLTFFVLPNHIDNENDIE